MLFGICLSSLLLSGCNLWPQAPTEHIQEPPLIPELSEDSAALQQAEMNRKSMILAYADLIDFNDMTQHNPLLHEAVATAIKLGVLKPTSPDERFNPQNPIHYDEFRTWTIAYQNMSSGNTQQPANNPADGSTSNIANPMNPDNLIILPSEIQWGDHRLTETHPVTRQELCALYVFLTRQEAAARSLSADAIESTTPGQKQSDSENMNLDEALSQFKDWAAIEPWARPYVAIAYRDNVLQRIFGLTPNRLTVDDGFHPQQPLTREESIVFLHSLYGHTALARQTLQSTTQPSRPQAEPSLANPQPISNLKAVHETGPNGSRSAIQINGPE
jgi:hypothetical protein